MKKVKYIILIFILIIVFGFISFFVTRKFIYPLKYTGYVEKYSEEYGIDKYFIYALIKAESNFDQDANSSKGAIGLMQLMENTANETSEKIGVEDVDLYDEETNIRIGTKYISDLIDLYEGNINLAIIAYNAGTGNVNKWIKEGVIEKDGSNLDNVPFKETRDYAKKILLNYKFYKGLYEYEF